MNSGTIKLSRPSPKCSSAPPESVTLPPAAVTTAWPAATAQPPPHQPERRRADKAEQRLAIAYQRKVDREFAAAGDELLGAVERIDQEEAAHVGRARLIEALLRQRRYVGRNPREPFA